MTIQEQTNQALIDLLTAYAPGHEHYAEEELHSAVLAARQVLQKQGYDFAAGHEHGQPMTYTLRAIAPKPKALSSADEANFETLRSAIMNAGAILISAVRSSDHAQVVLVCAINHVHDSIQPVPLAVMIEGDPYKLFEDPTKA